VASLHYSISIKLNDSLSEISEARAEIKAVALKTLTTVDLIW